ncbi:inhibitor of nuclear factor kappa-B kinase subunit alpha [Amyelois transitella]|uniref:inhibitor of nuclear factor kappa-B kinase subunit alpha n=1 Tax=Amyelois transitella TaxID=680683 RepID=UPI00067C23FA|nr:inhibitor of nuclear factor kappa-B kinase subunit alpha [Amyelois transitella]
MDSIVFIGDWVKDRVLGSGSFGTVVLWKHQKTDEKLAIKTCKWGDELTSKHKERWTKEVDMLQNCNNPNIVGTKELPKEFIEGLKSANPSKLPILCMEYCSGGSLRQLLNKPESCGGLKEGQVRQILKDIGNAMQFLHQNKITHRDIKPENIVIQLNEDNGSSNNGTQRQVNMQYKLIDLGYAKEIDSNSVCASFVGTLQYLAPEILYSKTYSNSVDFWSFGLLAFEVICGIRPFLPFMAPVQWMPHVKKKTHEDVCVYETFHGDIEYSTEIFAENHISKPFKMLIEQWLRMALEWDPKLRGRDAPSKVTFDIPTEEKKTASKIVIFNFLEEVLARRIIKIFSVYTSSQLAYEIDVKTTISNIKLWIEKDQKISIQDQIIISQSTYNEVNDNELVVNYWNDCSDINFYLYHKGNIIKENIEPIVPKTIQRCLEHPKALYNFKNQQNLYRNGLFFVINEIELYDSFIKGLFARGESLKHEKTQMLLKHNAIDKDIGKLLVRNGIVLKMVEVGKHHVLNLKQNAVGTNFLGGFEKNFRDTDDLNDKINKLQTAWTQLTVRLQSASRRSNEALTVDLNNFVQKYNYQNIFKNALNVFINYKRNESFSDYRVKEKQCLDVMKVCYDCLKIRSKIFLEIRNQPFMLKLIDLGTEFSKISEVIGHADNNAEKLSLQANNILEGLTNCMWSTISMLANDAHNLVDLPYSVVSFQKSNFKVGEAVSAHCIKMANKVDEDEALTSLIEESLKLRQSHTKLTETINMQKQLLGKVAFDFSFLQDKE